MVHRGRGLVAAVLFLDRIDRVSGAHGEDHEQGLLILSFASLMVSAFPLGMGFIAADEPLPVGETADQVRHKDVFGFHDIRVGNEPDTRLTKIHRREPTEGTPKGVANFRPLQGFTDVLRFARDRLHRIRSALAAALRG
jgi:hypothetical protein